MLTRKYYRMIAKVINNSTIINRRDITYIDKDLLVNDLSIEFKSDNHLFNRDRFVDACHD